MAKKGAQRRRARERAGGKRGGDDLDGTAGGSAAQTAAAEIGMLQRWQGKLRRGTGGPETLERHRKRTRTTSRISTCVACGDSPVDGEASERAAMADQGEVAMQEDRGLAVLCGECRQTDGDFGWR
ncbi:hypothetical protein Syun_029883 [Stephania yunnanensis]|uniref:Uncharacterized protein n=1 Tax=Stephania yunnanensis TaxID=152371 RepID=A0AAP0EEQ2_9MAGN